ncbi:MCM DNA helicase complex subunit [Coemansia spiralis]|uniref:DNA replication licensing factor MCM4 n=2 Tax=Coemansia TaxID=4863 RepID=A0A9W8GAV4_9FUNG|nr:MCM2/3/5 family-domain-containing protein [Coemansia spiralis]KAJ1993699.1 MCM DNA helicase complex subunit [Coemansia umbellata]KAJ2622935.1 MCM DNA helicase complex subunit [Coemansia sp. RSA 1358]KAJ2679455.1 MCM DNA helicase complex subunit [Coemansia spiralis]
MSGDPSSSPVLGHDSDVEEFATGIDEYNTLPETPAPFSPPPLPLARARQQIQQGGRVGTGTGAGAGARTSASNVVLSSSPPRLGFSDLPSTPGGGFSFGQSSQLAAGGMAMGYSEALSSQLGNMNVVGQSSKSASGARRGDLGSRAQALSSELGDMVISDRASKDAQPAEIRTIWGTIVHVREVMTVFKDFLLHFTPAHRPPADHNLSDSELQEPVYPQLIKHMHDSEIYQLNLDAQNICAYPPAANLYKQLANYPEEVVPIMDYVLTELYMEQFPDADVELAQSDLKVRPYNLSNSINMRDLNPSDIDKLVSIRGMLIRSSSVIPDMERAFFRCLQCDWTTTVGIDRGVINEPTQCGNTSCLQKDAIELVHNRSSFADKQLSRLQETPEVIPDGQTPHTLTLVMHDELVDVAKPGDRLEITGIYRGVPVRTNPRNRTVQAIYRTYVDVVHIRRLGRSRVQRSTKEGLDISEAVVDPQREAAMLAGTSDGAAESEDSKYQAFTSQEIEEFKRWSRDPRLFDILSRSLAPSIYEMEEVKRGLLLQLFGGVRKQFLRAGAPRSRGDINVLLVGDPGVSKSQMLSAVHALAPRGIYTSGKGSSAVGLTAYVTRDPDTRQLVLESGALVLSDDGICAIDEFDKMSESTRSVLHEVMEQQTISIAKAGIITSLNARCSILAAANPVDSKWNKDLSIVENMNLPPTLVSRFDLVFIVLDTVDETMDRRLARHIVGLYMEENDASDMANSEEDTLSMVPTEKLTRYIAYARRYVRPSITDEASDALVQEYVNLRRMGRDTAAANTTTGAVQAGGSANGRVTATARQLESMIRMSEAHARMRLSETVDHSDVREASRLMREALRESATDPRTGLIDLDLLNTGFAASDRRQLDAIKRETRNILLSAVRTSLTSAPSVSDDATAGSGNSPDAPHAGNSASYQTWMDRLNEQSYAPVPPRLFDQVIRELQTEGIINVVGTGRNMLIVVKQSAIHN